MYVKTVWADTFLHWAAFMASDQKVPAPPAASRGDSVFPILHNRGPLAIIGLCTARPVNPLLAVGTIGDAQLQRLEQILRESERRHLLRVVLIHHPPLTGMVGWRKRLTDADRFRAVLRRCGAELVLYGHVHCSAQGLLEGPQGKIPAIGVAAASASDRRPPRRARYHVYRFRRRSAGWEILMKVRVYSPDDHRFIPEREEFLNVPAVL